MKRKRNAYRTVLALFLAVLLVFQTLPLNPAAAYAQGAPEGSGITTIGEGSEPGLEVTESEVTTPGAIGVQPMALPMPMAAVPGDKTAVFMTANLSFPLEVKQGDPLVRIEPNGTIQGRQQFTLKSEGLKVPVNGDDSNPTNANPENYIQRGDWIELTSESYFKEVVLPTATRDLNAMTETGMKKLGTVYFTPASIKVVFDGDDSFFNGVGKGVTFSFETTADADVTGMSYGDTKPISIFGTAYQLKNSDVTPAYSITLSSPGQVNWDQYSYRGIQAAQFVEGAITWQSTVSAFDQFDNTIKLSLDGKTFFTNPTEYNTKFGANSGNVQGVYVEGSFKVNNTAVTPTIGEDGSLSYTFPEGTGKDPKVEYKTWIPKAGYYYEHRDPPGNLGRSYRVMFGRVELKEGSTKLVEAGQEISFAPDWIQASASYDHPNQEITWTINVNQKYNKKGLKNFTITNALPAGLELESATWQTWVDGVASEVKSIEPDSNSVYSFGDINGRVQLVIRTKVKAGSSFRIDPRANWELDTPGGIQYNDVKTGIRPTAVTDEAEVTIGAHAFTKSGSVLQADFNLGSVTWTVNLTPQYALPDAVVYDVLIHGGDLNVLDNAVDATGEVSTSTIAKIKANVNTAQLWKKYHVDSLKGVTNATGLSLKAIPLTVDGEVVADLIKVTGYNTDKPTSFSFRALETNPAFLFKQDINADKARWNRALLFDGEVIKSAQNSTNLHIRMLNKDMLFASKPLKADGTPENFTPNNIGSYISNDSNEAWTISAYDRTTKTVTFRLGINMPGYNTEELAKNGGNRVVSDIRLVDTLPEDWEFVPFEDGQTYKLYRGYSDNGSGTGYGTRNDAQTLIEPGINAHVVEFSNSGNVGTFTFSKLESPYVILVKARPSNVALEQYLHDHITNGTNKQVLYNKADLYMTWGGEEKVVTEQRKVIVPIQTLGKSVTKPAPGVLEWTVNYTPPFNMAKDVYLQDTLGAGMNLRKDESGKLVLTLPSMAVYRAKLTPSGALEREGVTLNLSAPNCEVQVEAEPGEGGTTVLKFMMNNPNQLYQFVYQTEVDSTKAKAGDKMGNEVKLMGDDKLKSISAKSESTLDSSDVAASSGSNALLPLKKVDPDGKPLGNVCFTLYKASDGTEVRTGKTGTDGTLNLIFPDPGYYELKETCYDENTYLPNIKIYEVYVGNTPGKPIWVDGVKVDSENRLTVPTPAAGKLTVKNVVKGNNGDTNKEFVYAITFEVEDEDDNTYTYTNPDGTKGTFTLKDRITFKLQDGATFVIEKLLAGVKYLVTQEENTDGHITDPAELQYTETIVYNGDHKADFINTRDWFGSLRISNTVTGSGSDNGKEFEYKIAFSDGGTYSYTKNGGSEPVNIASGGTISLKHDEYIVVKDIPHGVTYTVSQTSYADDGYTTNPGGELSFTGELEFEGKIVNAVEAQAPFKNNRQLPGTLELKTKPASDPGDPKDVAKVPGDGAHPAKLIASLIDESGKPVIGAMVTFKDKDGTVVGTAVTDKDGKAEVEYQADKVMDTDEKTYPFTATTTAKSPSGVPYKESNEVKVIATPAALFGILRDNTTGEVIPNAVITVENVKTGETVTITTDENGVYHHPVNRNEEYTITYNKMVNIGGVPTPVPFTQKADTEGSTTTEGKDIPAEITAVGIVLFKQPDGKSSMIQGTFAGNLKVYLKDETGKYIEEGGVPKAFPLDPLYGTFAAPGLTEQTYTMEVRYEVEPGKELVISKSELKVKADGELNISEELVDPYGTITDKVTGKVIEGAEVTLYYADTPRNQGKGITPGTKVTLPLIPGFAPNDNGSPSQNSDENGEYAYMVFPDTDYYLVVTKPGYETYTSGTISVGTDIVRYDVQMTPVSNSGGGDGGIGGGYTPQVPTAPKVSADDTRNILVGMNIDMEYSVDGGSWRTYDPANLPDLSGNHTVRVRLKAQGSTPAGEITTLNFTVKGSGNNANSGNSGNSGNNGNNGNNGSSSESGNTPQTPSAPQVKADDTKNILVGMDTTMEYSVDGGSWHTYDPANPPSLPGNHTVQVRTKATDTTPAGEMATLRFTAKGTAGNELDDVPKTGDNSAPLSFYLALGLMSLILLGICLPNRRKQSNI